MTPPRDTCFSDLLLTAESVDNGRVNAVHSGVDIVVRSVWMRNERKKTIGETRRIINEKKISITELLIYIVLLRSLLPLCLIENRT